MRKVRPVVTGHNARAVSGWRSIDEVPSDKKIEEV